jgi:pimeloyl-ACP methyl ester carboxylesterase
MLHTKQLSFHGAIQSERGMPSIRHWAVYLAVPLLTAVAVPDTAVAAEAVVDIPTRAGVTQRMLSVSPAEKARAGAVLLAGGHGGLKIFPNGSIGWGDRGFLVRTRTLFAQKGVAVVVIDAPSDRGSGLSGFRDSAEHAADIGAAIAWLRERTDGAVWLIGHSRGTESAASAAIQLGAAPRGPDGLVLAAPILSESRFVSGKAIAHYPLEQLGVPTLVLYHEADGCSTTLPRDLPSLAARLPESLPRKAFVNLSGGSPRGGGCDHESHHGFGGQDEAAVEAIVRFMFQP